jgi:ParB family transcriptional regulator, chromosome partitioning protein
MAKSAFPSTLGGLYKLDPDEDCFIPGIDGEPEFALLNQQWRVAEQMLESDISSVLLDGIIQPIIIRKRKDGRAEVIAGRQRVRWAREANKRLSADGAPLITVPALNDTLSKTEAIAVRKMVVENSHRVETNLMQRSDDAWALLCTMGETDYTACSKDSLQAAADHMRCSVATLRNYLALQNLGETAKTAAAGRTLPLNALVVLADLPEDQQEVKVLELHAAKASGATNADIIEDARTARDEAGLNNGAVAKQRRKAKAEASEADAEAIKETNGLRMGQIRRVLRLALEDRKEGSGAGTSLSDDHLKLLKVIVGEAEPRFVKGLTELLNRTTRE